jgi:large subunit ribosomal protein L32
MGVRMRVNKSHTGNRRSHDALNEPRLSACPCGAFHERHRACQECGTYRGRQVIDVVARAERAVRRDKRRDAEARAQGEEGSSAQGASETTPTETQGEAKEK